MRQAAANGKMAKYRYFVRMMISKSIWSVYSGTRNWSY
uniref:Uncharacterized protein n=1 Tax=Arundo donax TaxID=35708 RepID=A0A0A9T551_ARUDO